MIAIDPRSVYIRTFGTHIYEITRMMTYFWSVFHSSAMAAARLFAWPATASGRARKNGVNRLTALAPALLVPVACAGTPFTAGQENAAGGASVVAGSASGGDLGDAGSGSDAAAGYDDGSGASAGGSSSIGGAPAAGSSPGGKPSTGGQSGGMGSTSGTGGGSSCGFDEAKVALALPKTITWQTWNYAEGGVCGACKQSPCSTLNIIWEYGGKDAEGLHYNAAVMPTALTVLLGKGTQACTPMTECTAKISGLAVVLTVKPIAAGWQLNVFKSSAYVEDNSCLETAGVPSHLIAPGLGLATRTAIDDLKVPCE